MPGVLGDPTAVDAAADGLARAATRLVDVRDAVALGRHALGEAWLGGASLAAMAAVEGAASGTAVLAEVSAGVAEPLRVFAAELRRAQLDWAEGERMVHQGRAAIDAAGSGAPADAARDQGRLAVTDGYAVMDSAAERARIARETAARALAEATATLARLTPAPPSAAPDGDVWDGLGKAAGDVVDEVSGVVGGVIDHADVFGDRFGETWSSTWQTTAAAVSDPLAAGTAMVQGTVEPLVDSYRSGGWDEALGRSPGVIAGALGGKGIPKLARLADLPPPDPDPGPHTPLAPGGGLQRHEDAGGHTLDPRRSHVGATDQELLDRQATAGRPGATSTYADRQTAERAVHDNVAANREAIKRWLQSGSPRPESFELAHDEPIGRLAPRNASGLHDVTDATVSRVVLVRDAAMPDGYHILTSYPR